jgi:hypothetical protein
MWMQQKTTANDSNEARTCGFGDAREIANIGELAWKLVT